MNPKAARIFLSTHPAPAGDPSGTYLRALEAVRKNPDLAAGYDAQLPVDAAAAQALAAIQVPDETAAVLRGIGQAAAGAGMRPKFNLFDPAMLSVLIGTLLLAGLLAWHFLGRTGVFPEEALTVATAAVKMNSDQFIVLDEKSGDLEDWFLLKGFEKFRVPAGFQDARAAGARLFKVENEPVALLAIPENFMFFLVFDPAPFGIRLDPDGAWQIAEFDFRYAAAIRDVDGMCFMVVIKGRKAELEEIIAAAE